MRIFIWISDLIRRHPVAYLFLTLSVLTMAFIPSVTTGYFRFWDYSLDYRGEAGIVNSKLGYTISWLPQAEIEALDLRFTNPSARMKILNISLVYYGFATEAEAWKWAKETIGVRELTYEAFTCVSVHSEQFNVFIDPGQRMTLSLSMPRPSFRVVQRRWELEGLVLDPLTKSWYPISYSEFFPYVRSQGSRSPPWNDYAPLILHFQRFPYPTPIFEAIALVMFVPWFVLLKSLAIERGFRGIRLKEMLSKHP